MIRFNDESIKNEILVNSNYYKQDLSISHGLPGISLYCFEYARWKNDDKLIDHAINLFSESFYNLFKSDNVSLDLYSGTTGVYWLYQYLANHDFVDLDEATMFAYDELLVNQLELWQHNKNYDLIYGIGGIGVYFLERNLYTKNSHYLELLYNVLKKIAIKKKDKLYWKSIDLSKLKEFGYEEDKVDLGLAHGIGSIFGLFIFIYESTNDKALQNKIVEDLNSMFNFFEFYMQNSPKAQSVLPCQIQKNEFLGYPSRVAWCYGDLPLVFLFLKGEKITGQKQMKIWAETMLNLIVNRSFENSGIVDNGICHGVAGVVLILKKILLIIDETKKQMVVDKISYYEAHFLISPDEINDGKDILFDKTNKVYWKLNKHGFLEGLSGVGLSMIPVRNENSWTKLLML